MNVLVQLIPDCTPRPPLGVTHPGEAGACPWAGHILAGGWLGMQGQLGPAWPWAVKHSVRRVLRAEQGLMKRIWGDEPFRK